MVTNIWVNIASSNGFLLDGTKPYLNQFDFSSREFYGTHLRAISQDKDYSLKVATTPPRGQWVD